MGGVNRDSLEYQAASKYICCRLAFFGLLYLVVIIVAEWWRRTHTGCGIPVVLFCEVVFILGFVNELLLIPILCMTGNAVRIGIYYSIVSVSFLLVFIGWVIYGYVIYFSDDNNCQDNPHTAGWLIFMIILLFVGILVMIFLAFIFCLLCCVCCMDKKQQGENEEQATRIIDKIPGLRTMYDPSRFSNDTCRICLEKFKPEDQNIIQLKCHDLHIFH